MKGDRILVVDDEAAIVKMASNLLRASGDDYLVEGAGDPAAAIEKIRSWRPDLVLLDLQFGHRLTGLEVCKAIRDEPELSRTAVIVLTGVEEDIVESRLLEAGADDYIRKGQFNPQLLISRVRAVLRRTRLGAPRGKRPVSTRAKHIIERGPLLMDPVRLEAEVGGEELDLTPTEFSLLYKLAANPDRALKRAELAGREDGTAPPGRAVDVHILALRRKLGEYEWLVRTVLRYGYRLGSEPKSTRTRALGGGCDDDPGSE